jgi:hypothetical protein
MTKAKTNKRFAPSKKRPKNLKRGTPGYTYGMNWGLNLAGTWSRILKENKKKKLTDDQILQLMRKEFPYRKSFARVSQIRYFYNVGRAAYGYGDNRPMSERDRSVAYSEDGRALVGHVGRRPK